MKYFWDTLLDADLECDILGWQYISGSLPDGHDLNRLDDPELQGSKYDPEGEYVRQWLPELTRMPTEWIHHPWDAPTSVLRAAGVELGFNYPKPIIEMDIARQRLTEAICHIQGMSGASLGTNEVVVDNTPENPGNPNPNTMRVENSQNVEISGVPRTILNGKPGCISGSSRDQQVPSLQKPNFLLNGKRPRVSEGEREAERNPNPNGFNENNADGLRRIDEEEDLSSTADSSSAKKPSTSRNSFCVPQACCSISPQSKGFLDSESSDVKQSWKEHRDIE